MSKGLLYDARQIAARDPAAKSVLEVLLLYPGFHALIYHRLAHWLFKRKLLFLARLISQSSRLFTGIEIHPGAKIGKGLFIDHGMGIVIGETAEIGDNCTVYHGATLGGTGKEKGKRHPTVGSNVLIGAGAKLLGPITIGDNAMIGAGSVVLENVEADTTVIGPKARPAKHAGRKLAPSIELDQVHIADPVCQELCRMQLRIERLEAVLKDRKEIANSDGEQGKSPMDKEEGNEGKGPGDTKEWDESKSLLGTTAGYEGKGPEAEARWMKTAGGSGGGSGEMMPEQVFEQDFYEKCWNEICCKKTDKGGKR